METRPGFECFGDQWNPKDVDCIGGINYVKGGVMQTPCMFFKDESCKRELTARTASRMPQLIPTMNLTRPPAPAGSHGMPVHVAPNPQGLAPPNMPTYPGMAALTARLLPQQAQPVPQQQLHPHAPSYMAPHQQPQMPLVQYIAQDPHMPGYLHAPEPHHPGESVWQPLFREMARGAAKGLFHTLAAFVDNHVFAPRNKE